MGFKSFSAWNVVFGCVLIEGCVIDCLPGDCVGVRNGVGWWVSRKGGWGEEVVIYVLGVR